MTSVTPPEGLRVTAGAPAGATRLILVRHGEGVVNVSGVIGGPQGCTGLSDLGREQVAAMANRLGRTRELGDVDVVIASVLPRAKETAKIMCHALGVDPTSIEFDCDLCEIHPGEADGLVWEDYVTRFDAPDWDVDPSQPLAPGAESWLSFVDRVALGLDALVARHHGKLIVVGTHAGVIEASMITKLLGSPHGSVHPRLRLRTAHASLTEWEVADGRWLLRRYNDALSA